MGFKISVAEAHPRTDTNPAIVIFKTNGIPESHNLFIAVQDPLSGEWVAGINSEISTEAQLEKVNDHMDCFIKNKFPILNYVHLLLCEECGHA